MSRQLFGLFDDPRVHVLTGAVRDTAISSLTRKEAAALTGAVHKRRREFATARALAREGLERFFDVSGVDLLNADDRRPLWPPGIQGSISHSSARVWVALVDAAFGTVGIDGEGRQDLPRDLWHLTLRDEEIAYLETIDASVSGRIALILFSAKESLYKAQYPRSGAWVDFVSVRVELGEPGSLSCTFQQAVGPFPKGFVVRGRWLEEEELVTAVWIPASGTPRDTEVRRNEMGIET